MPTDRQTLRDTVLDVLLSIAPEVDPATIAPSRPLRQQVDLDSMDWLNVLIALNDRTGVQISEADYARLHTLDDLVGFLQQRLAATG